MIVDKLENLGLYVALNPLFEKVIAFIKENDLNKLPNGRHEIDGSQVFVNIEDDKGKLADEAVVEYHHTMTDIQVPLNTTESYGYVPVADLPRVPFNVEKDIAKVPAFRPDNFITLKPGEFAIFFPQDGHAPCIANGTLHKAVFKVAVNTPCK